MCHRIFIIIQIVILANYILYNSVSLCASQSRRDKGTPYFYLGIYIAFNVVVALLSFGKEIVGRLIALKASRVRLHNFT